MTEINVPYTGNCNLNDGRPEIKSEDKKTLEETEKRYNLVRKYSEIRIFHCFKSDRGYHAEIP